MNLAVWIVSGVLAALYLIAGFTKLGKTKQDLRAEPRMSWVGDFTEGQVKGIGAVEVAGAIGLVQVGAAITHIRRGEGATVPVNLVLCALAVFVAGVRFGQL